MADTPFKVGDTVQLKSGGPVMTVSSAGHDRTDNNVGVTWFASNEVKVNAFRPEMLDRA